MSLRGSLVTFVMVGTLAGAAAASRPETSAACFADNSVSKVVPHRATVPSGQGSYERLVGARAYVPAKPGLTGEWLHAQLAQRSATPQEGTQCPLDVPGVAISVTSAGPGFWVSLAARDQDDAKEVLRRAQTLAR
jgi:hypothetical protein